MQAGGKPQEAVWVIWEGAGEINVPCVPHKELQPREGNGQTQGGTAGSGKGEWGRTGMGTLCSLNYIKLPFASTTIEFMGINLSRRHWKEHP